MKQLVDAKFCFGIMLYVSSRQANQMELVLFEPEQKGLSGNINRQTRHVDWEGEEGEARVDLVHIRAPVTHAKLEMDLFFAYVQCNCHHVDPHLQPQHTSTYEVAFVAMNADTVLQAIPVLQQPINTLFIYPALPTHTPCCQTLLYATGQSL